MRQDWSEGNIGLQLLQYKQYQHIYINFFNIIQPALDNRWILAGDEAHNKDIIWVNIFTKHFKKCKGNR